MKEILESSESALFSYLTETRNLSNPIILIPKLKAGTLFEINNYKMWLSGQSDNYLVFRRATPVVLSLQDEYTLKNIFKYMDLKKIYKNATLYLHDEFNENALVRLYDVFLNKLATTVYNFFYTKQADELHAGRESFLALSAEEKCVFLSEFSHLFQCQSALADLHACGGSRNAGRIQLRMNVSDYNNLYIINQSVTGFFQERIKLS